MLFELLMSYFNYYQITDTTNKRLSNIQGYKKNHCKFFGVHYIKKEFGIKNRPHTKTHYEEINEIIERLETKIKKANK